MAATMVPLQSIVLSSAAASVTFSNIPQNYKTLIVKVSARLDSNPEASNWSSFKVYFNGDTSTLYSYTAAYGTGSSAGSERASGQTVTQAGWTSSSAATASTFGTADLTISNYTSSNFKSVQSDSVSETNSSAALQAMVAGLYGSTNAISSITFVRATANFVAGSSFYLYGIS